MEENNNFPESLLRKDTLPKSKSTSLKEILKEQKTKPRQPILIINKNWEEAERIIALIIKKRFLEIGRVQFEQVPIFNSLLLVQDVMDHYSQTRNLLSEKKVIIIDEPTIKVPFISRPDSWILDRIHYGFTMILSFLHNRSRKELETIIVTPEKKIRFEQTSISFHSFYQASSDIKLFEIPSK